MLREVVEDHKVFNRRREEGGFKTTKIEVHVK